MIVPEDPKAQAELAARIRRNLDAGDWESTPLPSNAIFIPMDEEGNILKEDEVSDDFE